MFCTPAPRTTGFSTLSRVLMQVDSFRQPVALEEGSICSPSGFLCSVHSISIAFVRAIAALNVRVCMQSTLLSPEYTSDTGVRFPSPSPSPSFISLYPTASSLASLLCPVRSIPVPFDKGTQRSMLFALLLPWSAEAHTVVIVTILSTFVFWPTPSA